MKTKTKPVQIPIDLHIKLKVLASEKGLSIRAFLAHLLRKTLS